jgi:drug/metabolite transporter (DMT)-like permease
MRRHLGAWLVWGTVGFGVFYVGLTYAASSGPSWLVASTFQLTIVAGLLLSPFIYSDARRRIPLRALGVGGVIIVGVLLTQLAHAKGSLDRAGWIALGSVVIAAFTYPLGNRMILLHLERVGVELSATQRVTGMTLACQPFWLIVAAHGARESGIPPWSQVVSAGGVALSAGVIATILFFRATAMVRTQPTALAAVEATQGGEILFATLIGVLFLGEPWPGRVAALGALLVIVGIVAFSRISAEPSEVAGHVETT